jgi:serine phosphatase RsbU (regulator of sigma subunit)
VGNAPVAVEFLRDAARLAALSRLREIEPAVEESFERLARLAARLFDAPIALVTLVDDARQIVKSSVGLPEPWGSAKELPIEWGFCVPTMTGGKPRLVAAVADEPEFLDDPAVKDLGAVSVACVPLVDDNDLAIGVLSVIDVAPRQWDDEARELITFLGRSIVSELQLRAELAEHQRLVEMTTKAAEREALRARQLRGLADTTVLLTTTISLDERLEIVTERARDLIGAHVVAVWKLVEGSRDDVRTHFALSDKYAEWRGREMTFPSERIYAEVLDTLRPLRLDRDELSADPRWLALNVDTQDHPPLDGLLAAPIVSSAGDARGVILLSDKYVGEFTPEDEAVLVQLARTVSRVSEHSRRFEREHEIAETLQNSFLPDTLPDVLGLDLASAYLPGTVGLAVGGDWYDAVPLNDQAVALVVGDVVGHGVRAAAIMGQLRNALRAYLHEGFRLSGVMDRLDRLADTFGGGDFATVVVAELEPATGWTRWVTAGQMPPLVVEPGGATTFLEGSVAPPLGSGLPSQFVESTVRIAPGSTLLLYSDGLVESRTQPLDEGMERLREAVVDALASGDTSAAAVVDCLVDRLTGPDREDDIALLVARMEPVPGAGGT